MTTPDPRPAQLRELHLAADVKDQEASRIRAERNAIVKQLRAEDKRYWTYKRLGEAMGSSSELATHIVKN